MAKLTVDVKSHPDIWQKSGENFIQAFFCNKERKRSSDSRMTMVSGTLRLPQSCTTACANSQVLFLGQYRVPSPQRWMAIRVPLEQDTKREQSSGSGLLPVFFTQRGSSGNEQIIRFRVFRHTIALVQRTRDFTDTWPPVMSLWCCENHLYRCVLSLVQAECRCTKVLHSRC